MQLADSVSLSESACLRRVRALEEAGYIDRYVALLNQPSVGLSGNVFVHIGLHREEESELAAFEGAVRDIPEVMECFLMTGEFDYLLQGRRLRHGRLRASASRCADAAARRRTRQLERRDSHGAKENRAAAALTGEAPAFAVR